MNLIKGIAVLIATAVCLLTPVSAADHHLLLQPALVYGATDGVRELTRAQNPASPPVIITPFNNVPPPDSTEPRT